MTDPQNGEFSGIDPFRGISASLNSAIQTLPLPGLVETAGFIRTIEFALAGVLSFFFQLWRLVRLPLPLCFPHSST